MIVDKLIGVVIILAIIAVVIILLFLGVWLTIFCKTMKEIWRAERELGITPERPHIKYKNRRY